MESLGHAVVRRRIPIIITWILLLLAGGAAAGKLADRWFESFSIPGFSAYEANQRTLKTFGTGEQPPLVAVFTDPTRDITTVAGVEKAIAAAAAAMPKPVACRLVVRDEELDVPVEGQAHDGGDDLPAGRVDFSSLPPIKKVRAALEAAAPAGRDAAPDRDAMRSSSRRAATSGPERAHGDAARRRSAHCHPALRLRHAARRSRCRCWSRSTSILTTFLCIYGLTYVTDVSIIVQFLVALVGLGVAIDYALLMIFRFREELSQGRRPRRRSSRRWPTRADR